MAALKRVPPSDPLYCSKCQGTGYVPYHADYANGVCFDCGGTGRMKNTRPHKAHQWPVAPVEPDPPSKPVVVLGVRCKVYKLKHGFQVSPAALPWEQGFPFTVAGGKVAMSGSGTGTAWEAFGCDDRDDDRGVRQALKVLREIGQELQRKLKR